MKGVYHAKHGRYQYNMPPVFCQYMKSRLTYECLPEAYKKDVERLVISFEQRYRDALIERFIAAMLLTLRDCFGFGIGRMNRMLHGFQEIVHGYDEESYYGVEKSMQNMETMNRKMRDELAISGIQLSSNHGNIMIKTINMGGQNNEPSADRAENQKL